MSALFRAIGLSKKFGRKYVLNGLDLEVPQGSVFGLIGSNGAGKTTTIKILMNILKPDAGRAEVLGRDSRCLGPAELSTMGYVSENQEMPGWMTVSYLMRYLKPFYPGWDDARAAELLTAFELPLDRKLAHLSRGMFMKVALASSLAYRPRLLVLDEPFSGLDPLVREDLVAGLIESAEETTILISSHDLGEIETFASHVGYLEGGSLRFSEEMNSLAARFREVEVTFDPEPAIPAAAQWPDAWLRRESMSSVARFVDSQFEAERTAAQIRAIFGSVRNISARPIPLRQIFIALARNKQVV